MATKRNKAYIWLEITKSNGTKELLDYFDMFEPRALNVEKAKVDLKFNAIDLVDDLKFCTQSVGDRFAFIILTSKDGKVWMSGTDGFRASFVRDLHCEREAVDDFEVYIDIGDISNILSVLPNDEVDIHFIVSEDGKAHIYFENFYSTSLLINQTMAGNIFSLLEAKPKPEEVVFTADLSFFMKAIGFLSLMALDGANKMGLRVSKENARMEVITEQIGNSVWDMPIFDEALPDEPVNFTINPNFVRQYLSTVKPTSLKMCLSKTEGYPVYLENENPNQVFLFMPMM